MILTKFARLQTQKPDEQHSLIGKRVIGALGQLADGKSSFGAGAQENRNINNNIRSHYHKSMDIELKETEFAQIRRKIHDYCGINLHEGKHALVRARVMKRIRKLQLAGFAQYLDYLEQDTDGKEFLALVDVLTTNKTSFFREDQHFDFMKRTVIPEMKNRKVKWWSAGCSTGEEAISCAITLLQQQVPEHNVKILATDISREVLRTAKHGVYRKKLLKNMPTRLQNDYFNKAGKDQYKVKSKVRNMITFGRLNLQKKWPLKGPFHVIMCRNVMIYFNRETQQQLVNRFYNILQPGGYLFLGHSESVASSDHLFTNIQPAVYQKA